MRTPKPRRNKHEELDVRRFSSRIDRTEGVLIAVALALSISISLQSASAVSTQGVSDFNQTPFYADKSFNAAHQDARNSDFYPYVMPSRYRIKWDALNRTRPALVPGFQGTATYFGPSQGIDGGLFQHDARGTGFSHLHKLDPETGEALAQVPRWWGHCVRVEDCIGQDLSTPDFLTASQAPLVDKDGNVYIADIDQLWSYDKDLNFRWVTSLVDAFGGETSQLISSIFTNDGLVGGISANCKVLLVDRNTGELAVPVAQDAGCDEVNPTEGGLALALAFIWYTDGEVYFPFRQIILRGLFGGGGANTNTPAVSPTSLTSDSAGRIFYVVSKAVPSLCDTDPDFAGEGMEGTLGQIEQALLALPGGSSEELQDAFNAVRWGRGQLDFTRDTLKTAKNRNQLTPQRAKAARQLLHQAKTGPMTVAYDSLLKDPDPNVTDQLIAKTALMEAYGLIEAAEAKLRCLN